MRGFFTLAVIAAGQRVGLSLDAIKAALDELPVGRAPSQADWTEMSRQWAGLVAERIREPKVLETPLEGCIGCGCLSVERCSLMNAGDAAAGEGSGSRWLRRARREAAGTP